MAKGSPLAGRLGDQRPGDRVRVTAGAVEQVGGQQGARSRRGSRLAHQGRAAGVHLEAAAVAAAAADAVGHDAHVADLRADPEGAAVQRAVEDDAATHAGADGHQQQVVDVVAGTELELAPRRRVGVVLDHHRQAERRLQVGLEVEVAPGEVGREQHDRAGLVDVAGRADADGLDRVPGAQLGDQLLDRGLDGVHVGGRRLDLKLLEDRARPRRRRRRRSWCRRRRCRRRASSVVLRPVVVDAVDPLDSPVAVRRVRRPSSRRRRASATRPRSPGGHAPRDWSAGPLRPCGTPGTTCTRAIRWPRARGARR